MKDFIAKITSKGQITLPKELRDSLKMSRGDYVMFHMRGDKIEVEKAQITGQAAFAKLSAQVQQQFQENKVAQEDIDKARKWAQE